MKTIKQLLRQPLKTLLGVILMTLAVAVLCICVGQALATQNTKKALDERFSSVAIPSLQEDLIGADQLLIEEELTEWLDKIAREHPDIVKGTTRNGLLSAYIPQLTPYNVLHHGNEDKLPQSAFSKPAYAGETHFDSAMLVITLETVSEPVPPMEHEKQDGILSFEDFATLEDYLLYLEQLEKQSLAQKRMPLEKTYTDGYTVTLTGTVTETVALAESYRNPVGMTARLTLTLPSLEDIEALNLVPGQQYIVYGMDYFDDYQYMVQYMKTTGFKHVSFVPFDPELLRVPTEDEIRRFKQNKKIDVYMIYNNAPLEQWQYELFNTVSMTLCSPINLLPYEEILDESGTVVDKIPQTEVTYTDGNGNTVTLTAEEFTRLYEIPTIARLDGSSAEFLASKEGEKWSAALEQIGINNHGFAVVGVNDIHQVAAFSLEMATIGEGREFTTVEVASGAKVCIIHEWVAQNAGLQIGDTITLSFYPTDYGIPYQTTLTQEANLYRPAASLYFSTTPMTETAEYTIVGFWQGTAWPATYYSFSANTVFIPQTSVQTPMEHPNSIPFITVALENGTIQQFHDLAKRSGYAGRFKYIDQGYADIAVNFHNYESLGQQIMAVGAAVYIILLLLFLVLYPSTQRKTVYTMESMGCHYGQRFGHVLLSSMSVMLAASALGCLIGSALWDRVVAALQTTAETSIALQLEPGMLAMVAAAQLILALLLNILVAFFIAAPRGLSARR